MQRNNQPTDESSSAQMATPPPVATQAEQLATQPHSALRELSVLTARSGSLASTLRVNLSVSDLAGDSTQNLPRHSSLGS